MKEGWEGLDGDVNIETGDTLGEERADVGTLMDRDVRLCQSEVSSSPAVLERCEKSTKKRYDEAEKPE